ncbi:MAG: DUF4292 domain-containing protein [Bacteroidota bacterium]
MNKSLLIALLLLFTTVGFFSCKTSRHHELVQPLKEQGPDYLFDQMKKSEFNYKTLSLKFSADVESNGENSSFSGNIYLIRDSLMWISIQKFGLEAVRLLITTDSAKMINRINKTYFVSDFDKVNQLFKTDFDFDILQSILTGNDFTYYEGNVFKANIELKWYHLSTPGRHKIKKYVKTEKEYSMVLIEDLWLDPSNFKIVKTALKEIKTQDKRKMECEYSNFLTLGDKLFPQKVEFEITDEKKLKGTINFTRISPEKVEDFPFNIPSSYTKSK